MPHEDPPGPTARRLQHAGPFFTEAGPARSRHYTMLDDSLGRAWRRQKISAEEYAALRRYALHWLAGGLQGHLGSVDLNRVLAFDPAAMSGLARTEKQADHRQTYYAAHQALGLRPAFVADQVACIGSSLRDVGLMLGYQSAAHGRAKATEILSDAGHRLTVFWKEGER